MRKHKKKIGRMRGKRTHGGGASKNRRGRGSRKTNKRTFTTNIAHVRKYEPWRINKKGFFSRKIREKAVNLSYINIRADKEIDVTELGFGKVLGGGNITKPLKIKAHVFSKKAKEKIEKAGGEAVEV